MSNYKVKVNNEAESKEVQGLFFELGASLGNGDKHAVLVPSIIGLAVIDDLINFVFNDVVFADIKQCEELTIPQLKDLVVLKRNSIDYATHTGDHGSLWYLGDAKYCWRFDFEEWELDDLKNKIIKWGELKPIKKEMKEYLEVKEYLDLNDNYSYHKVPAIAKGTNWIEVPEWANYAYNNDQGICFLKDEVGFNHPLLLWQRHTQPEELPFVDEEPLNASTHGLSKWFKNDEPKSLNHQYAEIEAVRQSRTADQINLAAMLHIIERGKTYDSATGERSAHKTAIAFNAVTGHNITEAEVFLLLQILKDVRQWSKAEYHQDSAEDSISYAALKAEALERQ